MKEYKTKAKDYILTYIYENREKGFSIKEVSDFLSSKNIQMDNTTIYRNLEKMYKKGELLKRKEDCFIYQYVDLKANCNKHIHLQCIKCKKLIHTDRKFMEELSLYLEKADFILDCTNSTLLGKCKDCV